MGERGNRRRGNRIFRGGNCRTKEETEHFFLLKIKNSRTCEKLSRLEEWDSVENGFIFIGDFFPAIYDVNSLKTPENLIQYRDNSMELQEITENSPGILWNSKKMASNSKEFVFGILNFFRDLFGEIAWNYKEFFQIS